MKENTEFYGKIEIIKNGAAELLNYMAAFVTGYILLKDFIAEEPDLWGFALLAGVPLFYYFLREKSKVLLCFLLFHFLPYAAILLLYQGRTGQKVAMAGITVGFMTASIVKRVRDSSRGMEAILPPAALGLFFVLYLVDWAQMKGKNSNFLLKITIIYAAGYFIYYFLQQFLSYIDMNARTNENIQAARIFYPAAGMAGGFAAAAVGITAVGSDREWMDRIGFMVRRMIVKFLTWLIALLPKKEIEQEVQTGQGGMPADPAGLPGQPQEELLLFKILDMIISAAVLLFVLLFLTAVFWSVVKLVRAGFMRRKKERLIAEGSYADRVESIEPSKEERKNKKGFSFVNRIKETLSPEEKIRRIYCRTMMKNVPSWEGEKKAGILKQATARECCRQFFPDNRKDAYAFAELYERARYGRGMCSQEDVRRAKMLSEKLSRG